jgi:dienelactone hydrolase
MKIKRGIIALLVLPSLMIVTGCESPTADNVFEVGSTTVFIHDDTRPFDAVAGVNDGVRTLITEIWYPAQVSDKNSAQRATYGDYSFGDMAAHTRMMTETSFYHLTPESVLAGVTQAQIDAAIAELFDRPRGSYVDAPVAQSTTPFPVIVMSHGDAGSRYNMETVCEYLASHGYIVIAPEHTGNSPFSLIGKDPALVADDSDYREKMKAVLPLLDEHGAYAHDKIFGQSYTPSSSSANGSGMAQTLMQLDAAFVERVNDLRAAIKQLETMNQQGFLSGKIDLNSMGLMGRSFGGSTTLLGLALEDRFKAGMSIVPMVTPDLRNILPKELLKPVSVESAILSAELASGFAELKKPTLILSGVEDQLIISSGKSFTAMVGLPEATQAVPYPVVSNLIHNTQQSVLFGLAEKTNHASFGVSGPYWWPQLKPDTFARTFAPEQEYQLMPSLKAHQIQKEKALEFFDVFVKADETQIEKLKANTYGEELLRWQVKNL